MSQEQKFAALGQRLQAEFDNLDPDQYAKRIWAFGDWIGRYGASLSPADRALARGQYDFYEDKLSLWLGYRGMPNEAKNHLLGAAYTLYMNTVHAGLVRPGQPGGWPTSMKAVAMAAMAYDGPSSPSKIRAPVEEEFHPTLGTISEIDANMRPGLGGLLANAYVKIRWRSGISSQGIPWEAELTRHLPGYTKLPGPSKTWDFFDESAGAAVSAKTLDTFVGRYLNQPGQIYSRLKPYVDAAADYKGDGKFGYVAPSSIRSKTIQLAVPVTTNHVQMLQVQKAAIYARFRGVNMVVTRVMK